MNVYIKFMTISFKLSLQMWRELLYLDREQVPHQRGLRAKGSDTHLTFIDSEKLK